MTYSRDPRVHAYLDAAPDPEGIITGGHDNETGRMIQIRRGDPINERAMVEVFRAIIADNRSGGWRKLKRA